tara:strand:+ start:69 stop:1085 length:1017 start_codon:yes stop_codon:yes gene_type:complete
MSFLSIIPKAYQGSALNFIQTFIIPALPKKDDIIDLTKSIEKFIEMKEFRYVRKFKEYSSRGKIYSHGSQSFTVTDNEPALWAYMECLAQSVNSFEHYHDNSTFPIAFALNSEERNEFDSRFNYGKQKREKEFSQSGLKHCHILDCSPRGFDLSDLNLDQRMFRLLSPMNHFPFPGPRNYTMSHGDIGEDVRFLSLVKSTLCKEFYSNPYEKDFFLHFLRKSGDKQPILFVDDFEIRYSLKSEDKPQQNLKSKSKNKPETHITSKITTYFKLDQRWYGQGRIIKVQFNQGNYQDTIYSYNHDEVYEKTLDHLENLACWEKDRCYSCSTGIPGWAKKFC